MCILNSYTFYTKITADLTLNVGTKSTHIVMLQHELSNEKIGCIVWLPGSLQSLEGSARRGQSGCIGSCCPRGELILMMHL